MRLIETLLAEGLNPNHSDNMGQSLLKLAAANGDTEIIKALLAAGADVNLCDDSGATPLAAATVNQRESAVQLLLSSGADPNVSNPYVPGWTALIGACTVGNIAIASDLLEAGASIDVSDAKGRTPLSEALAYGHRKLAQLLQDASRQ